MKKFFKNVVAMKGKQDDIQITFQVKECRINQLETKLIKRIYSYLNVIEIVIISRVCPLWKKIIDKSADVLLTMDLSILPNKVNSLNFIKVLSKAQQLQHLVLPMSMAITDTLSFLMMVPKSLLSMRVMNVTIDFSTVLANVSLPNLTSLDLSNDHAGRKKPFNSNEIKAIARTFPNLTDLNLNGIPINDEGLQLFFTKVDNLQKLSLLRCPNLTNIIFYHIAKFSKNLKSLSFGGSPTEFNQNFTFEGINMLCQLTTDLEELRMEYCSRIGEKCMVSLLERFGETLREFHVVRNCFEKCSKITDELIASFEMSPYIEKLTFNYVRSFGKKIHIHLAHNFHKLRILNLRECPIQEDFTILAKGCPLLEEVDLSGDSWVKCETVVGLSKHPNLRVFKMGHLEHAEGHCDGGLGEFPPKGMLIESIFKDSKLFPRLKKLYLEQVCGLTYWLDVRIKKLRPEIEIKYTLFDKTMSFSGMVK